MTDYYPITIFGGVNTDVPVRQVIRFKQGQFGGTHYFQFYDTNGDTVDLTGGTVTFRTRTPAGTVTTLLGTLTIETASTGKAYYVPTNTSFATSGAFISEFRIAYSTTRLDYSTTLGVIVEPEMPDT